MKDYQREMIKYRIVLIVALLVVGLLYLVGSYVAPDIKMQLEARDKREAYCVPYCKDEGRAGDN